MTKKVPDTAVRNAAKSRSLSSLTKLPSGGRCDTATDGTLEEVENHGRAWAIAVSRLSPNGKGKRKWHARNTEG